MKLKELRELRKIAHKHGWHISRTKGGSHEMWYSPDKRTMIAVGRNASSPRTLANLRLRLKKAGLPI